jgi:hypothetical protein
MGATVWEGRKIASMEATIGMVIQSGPQEGVKAEKAADYFSVVLRWLIDISGS